MNILAMDTSTAWAGVALEFDGTRNSTTWRSVHNHGRELVPSITDLMASASCDISELDCIAVALGPGGFSAVRVGVSCALGIASPRGLITVGIPTHYLQARAWVAELGTGELELCGIEPRGTDIGPAELTSTIPIGRDQCSVAEFDFPLGPIDIVSRNRICNNSELMQYADQHTTVTGEGVQLLDGDVNAERRNPRPPEIMLDIALESVNQGVADAWPVRPIYAREPTITRPGAGTRR